jgi:predicted small lipoprotein YifL
MGKGLISLSAVLALLFMTACGREGPVDLPAGQEISGIWELPFSERAPAQEWEFLSDGRFRVDEGGDGNVEFEGSWTVEDDRLILAYREDSALCPALPGAYIFTIQGSVLQLQLLDDECEHRRRALAGQSLQRPGQPL